MSEEERECLNCGPTTNLTHYSYYECDDCYEPVGSVSATKDSELEEVVEELEEQAETDEALGRWDAADRSQQAANKLKELMGE